MHPLQQLEFTCLTVASQVAYYSSMLEQFFFAVQLSNEAQWTAL